LRGASFQLTMTHAGGLDSVGLSTSPERNDMNPVKTFAFAVFLASIAVVEVDAQTTPMFSSKLGMLGAPDRRDDKFDGKEYPWEATVYQCPDKPRCEVQVNVTVSEQGCDVKSVNFIDLHPKRKRQKIVWNLVNKSDGSFELAFVDEGIYETRGSKDLDEDHDKSAGIFPLKTRSLKRKHMSRDFLTYDILLQYRKSGTSEWLECDPKGPAIVNRG
jgi:hypothetical protein